MPDLRRVFDGSVTIEETERSCEEAQRRKRVQLVAVQLGVAEIDGKDVNVNVADFTKTDIQAILDDLRFIDVSTVAGAAAAAAAAGTHKPMFDCKMYIKGTSRDVKIFGKKSDD